MNHDFDFGEGPTNQIAALSAAGYFAQPVSNIRGLRALANPSDESVSREFRVRSLLFANCVQCHQPGGVANASWDARLTTPIDRAGIVEAIPFNSLGDSDGRILKSGSPAHSILFKRISTRGANQMPPLGTGLVDQQAVDLLSAWVTEDLPEYEQFTDWQVRVFGSNNAPQANPNADPDGDGASNYSEYLSGTNPRSGADAWKVFVSKRGDSTLISFVQPASRGCIIETKDSLDAKWLPLNVEENSVTFPSAATNRNIFDEEAAKSRYYRVRMLSP